MFGGRIVQEANLRREKPDYNKVGKWLDKELKKRQVWAILMPRTGNVTDSPFLQGIERHPDWQLVFLSRRQKLIVDIKTAQGKKLFEGIFNKTTVYPNDYYRNIMLAHNLLRYGQKVESKKQGLMLAIQAFELRPSVLAMRKILFANRIDQLRPTVIGYCQKYLEKFMVDKDVWVKEDGYRGKIVPAIIACNYLSSLAEISKDQKLAKFYLDKRKEYEKEFKAIIATKRW